MDKQIFKLLAVLLTGSFLAIGGNLTSCGPTHHPLSYNVEGPGGEQYWLAQFRDATKMYAEPRPIERAWGGDYDVRIFEQEKIDGLEGSVYTVSVGKYPEAVRRSPDCGEEDMPVQPFPSITIAQRAFSHPDCENAELSREIIHWLYDDVFAKDGRVDILDPAWWDVSAKKEAHFKKIRRERAAASVSSVEESRE